MPAVFFPYEPFTTLWTSFCRFRNYTATELAPFRCLYLCRSLYFIFNKPFPAMFAFLCIGIYFISTIRTFYSSVRRNVLRKKFLTVLALLSVDIYFFSAVWTLFSILISVHAYSLPLFTQYFQPVIVIRCKRSR